MSSEPPDNPFEAFAEGDRNVETRSAEELSAEEFLAIPESNIESPKLPSDGMQRLHWSSLVFDLLSYSKSFVIPLVLALLGAAKGDATLLIISGLGIIPAILVSVFRYFTYRFCIRDNHLIVRQGLIFKSVRTVPVERIQNVDFVQNILHRMVQVAEVRVETASGTKPEATLRVLSVRDMEALRTAIFAQKAQQIRVARESVTDAEGITGLPNDVGERSSDLAGPVQDTTANAGETILRIPIGWLVKAGIASNRGLIMVGLVLGAYFQFTSDNPRDHFRWIQQFLPESASTSLIIIAATVGVLVALVALRLLGIGWFLLRFFGYRLTRHGDDLRISCGMFTRVSATIPRRRIQFISVHQRLIMRWFGLASVRIETAGGGGSSEDASESVSKRWFVPVIPHEQVPSLLASLRPGLVWQPESLDFQPLHRRATQRLCRLAVISSILVGVVGLFFSLYFGWVIGLVVLPLFWNLAIRKGKAMRYARTENGVVYKSGVLTKKVSMTFFEKIQTLSYSQSPFDRRWGMARLGIDTAAAGPAEHLISIPYLDSEFAAKELQQLRVKTGQQQPVFS